MLSPSWRVRGPSELCSGCCPGLHKSMLAGLCSVTRAAHPQWLCGLTTFSQFTEGGFYESESKVVQKARRD